MFSNGKGKVSVMRSSITIAILNDTALNELLYVTNDWKFISSSSGSSWHRSGTRYLLLTHYPRLTTVSNGGKNNHGAHIKCDKNPFFGKQSAVDTDG
jgi:hypothetical protein